LAAGRAAVAKEHFRHAIDEDVCPLRALTPMHSIERRAARATGGGFVDFEDSLRAAVRPRQGHDILGDPDFTDHVHLTVAHYGVIARGVLAEMTRMGLVPAIDSVTAARALSVAAKRIYARLTPAEEGLGYHNIAKVLNWAGKTSEANRAALHGLEKDTVSLESIWSSLFVGAELERQGESRRALPYYRRALRLDSTNAESWRLLGDALVRLGDSTAGFTLLEEAAMRDPENLRLQENVGRLAYARRRFDLAVPHLRIVAARDPRNTAPRVLLAGSFIALGRAAEAETELRAILSVNPREAGAWFGMGFLFESRGQIQEAIQHYAEAARLDPSEPMSRAALARVLGQ
jgi:tetratricopeptide (TPR) repeat protein